MTKQKLKTTKGNLFNVSYLLIQTLSLMLESHYEKHPVVVLKSTFVYQDGDKTTIRPSEPDISF